jgi:CRISP-associated protein Cas1
MKRHLNTLFVTTDGAYLAREGLALRVMVEKQERLRVPVHTIGSVVVLARANASTAALALCAEHGVAVSLCTSSGRLLARSTGFTPGNVLLRRDQYRAADDPTHSLAIAAPMVAAKIANARTALLRAARDHGDASGVLSKASGSLATAAQCALRTPNLDTLRGVEGDAAAAYFSVLDALITLPTPEREPFRFSGRNRRPPLDRLNALLSFLYALLTHDARSACEAAGLDPAVGFLHTDRPGRPSLALDLIEELRAFLADRLVLSLINRRQLTPESFEIRPGGAVRLTDHARRAVVTAYQTRKQEELLHPYLQERVTVGLLVHLQARLLSRVLRGELDAYPAFIWK